MRAWCAFCVAGRRVLPEGHPPRPTASRCRIFFTENTTLFDSRDTMGRQKGVFQQIADETGYNQAAVRRALEAANVDIKNLNFETAVQIVRAVVDSERALGHAANGRGEGGDGMRNPLAEARARSELARARKLELRNAQDEGRLVDRETVAETGEEIIVYARAAILSLGCRVAPRLIGKTDIKEITKIIEDEARVVLGDLADENNFLRKIDEALT